MAYVPANNVLQVELRGLQGGQEVEMTQYHARGDTIETGEVTAMLDWYEDIVIPEFLPLLSSGFAFDEIYCTDLTTSSSPTYTRVLSPTVPGTAGGDILPGNNACCISFRTAGRGRSARGRNYAPALVDGAVTGNLVDLGHINALVEVFELLLGGGTYPSGWEWVVISRILAGLPRIAALIQPITDVLSTDITVDSQRGRLR